jgi:hypothetical protein
MQYYFIIKAEDENKLRTLSQANSIQLLGNLYFNIGNRGPQGHIEEKTVFYFNSKDEIKKVISIVKSNLGDTFIEASNLGNF